MSYTLPIITSIDDRPLHHTVRKSDTLYDNNTTKLIQCVYLFSTVLWILLVKSLGIYNGEYMGLLFLSIPVIVYMINYVGCKEITKDVEQHMFKGNFLSFGYLIVVIFMNWNSSIERTKFFKTLVISIILLMLSLVDLWVCESLLILSSSLKSIFQTASLGLLSYSLYMYYLDNRNKTMA